MINEVEITNTVDFPTVGFYDSTGTAYSNLWTYSSPIYYYQIFCPKPRCKQANWLELNKIKECSKCGSMLKAVLAKPDYEVEVS